MLGPTYSNRGALHMPVEGGKPNKGTASTKAGTAKGSYDEKVKGHVIPAQGKKFGAPKIKGGMFHEARTMKGHPHDPGGVHLPTEHTSKHN